jgi:hypothetical protein
VGVEFARGEDRSAWTEEFAARRTHADCFNQYIYTRRVLTGEYQVVCPWLLCKLIYLGLWNDQMKNMIIAHNTRPRIWLMFIVLNLRRCMKSTRRRAGNAGLCLFRNFGALFSRHAGSRQVGCTRMLPIVGVNLLVEVILMNNV